MSTLPTEKQITYLIGELCSRLGFCSPPEQYDRFIADTPPSTDAFTRAVFEAEGLDPSAEPELWSQARNLVARTFER